MIANNYVANNDTNAKSYRPYIIMQVVLPLAIYML